MGKKKAAEPHVLSPLERRALADQAFQDVVQQMAFRSAKEGRPVSRECVHVLPVPSLAMRWLLQNEGLLLNRIYHLVGPWASYKSTFCAEVVRWFRLCGGFGYKLLTENKESDEMQYGILGWDRGAIHLEECQSVEDWQDMASAYTKLMQKKFSLKDGPGRTIPIAMLVDSIGGALSQGTIDKIEKFGHAKKRFPDEAQLNTDYLKYYARLMNGWPFTLWLVNHLKYKTDPNTGELVRNSAGGDQVKFGATSEIELKKLGKTEDFKNFTRGKLQLKTFKNTYGVDQRKIQVNIRVWKQQDADGQARLYSRFEWWEASIRLLMGEFFTKGEADVFMPLIDEVIDLHEKSSGNLGKLYWSNVLGVTSENAMSAHDLGVLLEQRVDILTALYPRLRIERRPFFQPGVDFISQMEEYRHVQEQAQAALEVQQRLDAAGTGQHVLPGKVRATDEPVEQ